LRLVQAYGRSVRSKDDWARTYVLDSAFLPFVRKNKNILPHWFIQAIQANLKAPLGQTPLETVNVSTPSKEDHNAVMNNHYNPSIISEETLKQNVNTTEKNEIASTTSIKMPSGTLTSLDCYNEDESIRPEQLFICPYCPKFSSTLEREYQRHIVLNHRGKSGYPNTSVAG
jgi:hypothetical protein